MANRTPPSANRYEALVVGPRLGVTYEVQAGKPVDGSSPMLRDLSPFQIRILPPDILVELAGESVATAAAGASGGTVDPGAVEATTIGLYDAALRGNNSEARANTLANALARVSIIQTTSTGQFTSTADLEALIANGEFLKDQGDEGFPTITDAATAADIAIQLQAILQAPPLILLINPKDMTLSFTNIQNYGTRTRYGYVFERWGEEQPSLSISGSTGAFIAGASNLSNQSNLTAQVSGNTNSPTGVQFACKRDSAAFQNLMALYTFYRNNGYIYDKLGHSEAHHFIGSIAIDYDQWTYVGHFESFGYSYDEGMPHRIEWKAEFKVSRMYDWANSPATVLPQRSPTQSISSGTANRTGKSPRSTPPLGKTLQTVQKSDEDVGQVPLDLLGGF